MNSFKSERRKQHSSSTALNPASTFGATTGRSSPMPQEQDVGGLHARHSLSDSAVKPGDVNAPGPANAAPRTGHTFGQYAITRMQAQQKVPPVLSEVMQRASADGSHGLDAPIRETLEEHLGHDFSQVQVHSGAASAEAAAALNARAFTLGRDIYLGEQANTLNGSERATLLAHEAVHTIQQGSKAVQLQAGLAVSHPTDAAEVEAEQIARSVLAPVTRHSPALTMRDQLRAVSPGPGMILRSTTPLIQRDLKPTIKGTNGEFIFNFVSVDQPPTTAQKRMETGMIGDLSFKPYSTSPESDDIELIQVVRLIETTQNVDYDWATRQSEEGARNDVRTVADTNTGVEGGFFLDTTYEGLAPRQQGQPDVSPYYTDTPGKHRGTTIEEAKLHDEPMAELKANFKFETAAKAKDTGFIYGAVKWGFTVNKVAKDKKITTASGTKKQKVPGEVINADAQPSTDNPSATFNAALKNFNDKYNP